LARVPTRLSEGDGGVQKITRDKIKEFIFDMWRKIINRCNQKKNEEAIANRKREREESLVYTNGSDALKEAIDYLVTLFDTFELFNDRYVGTDTFDLLDIPHWEKVTNRKAELASLEASIQQILPPAFFDGDEDTGDYSIQMLTEEAVDQDIKEYQEELERLKRIKQL
jgi:hypothetical protein